MLSNYMLCLREMFAQIMSFCCLYHYRRSIYNDATTNHHHHDTHNTQLYNSCPSASLDYIIEPWFLGPGSEGPGGPEFNDWAKSTSSTYNTQFLTSVADLPTPAQPRVALISGRTADNPRLLNACIDAGCKCIYLEKPGAPTVNELQDMMECAEKAGIEVLMGYNKVSCLNE